MEILSLFHTLVGSGSGFAGSYVLLGQGILKHFLWMATVIDCEGGIQKGLFIAVLFQQVESLYDMERFLLHNIYYISSFTSTLPNSFFKNSKKNCSGSLFLFLANLITISAISPNKIKSEWSLSPVSLE